jgi:hypothetical protein
MMNLFGQGSSQQLGSQSRCSSPDGAAGNPPTLFVIVKHSTFLPPLSSCSPLSLLIPPEPINTLQAAQPEFHDVGDGSQRLDYPAKIDLFFADSM